MTTLISLVGEQPIPNLIPLWHDQSFDAVEYIASEVTLNTAKTMAELIGSDSSLAHVRSYEPRMINAFDIQQARQVMAASIAFYQKAGHQVCLNLTGGTKLMSLAALQAAYGTGVDILYVSTTENSLIYHHSDMSEFRREPINVHITVSQYLQAHGLEISDNLSFKNRESISNYHPPKEGDVLEERVFQDVQGSGRFDDVRRNIFIRKQTSRGPVINELDVIATRNGRMAVCSCKSKKHIEPEDMNKFLYELYSLSNRDVAGIYCGKLLALATDDINESGFDRARTMNIIIVPGAQLQFIVYYFDQSTQ